VLVDGFWVLGLPDDLEQVVVGQEVEPGELTPLGFQELVQVLLDLLQFLVQFLQRGDETFDNKCFDCISVFIDSFHFSFEDLVNSVECR